MSGIADGNRMQLIPNRMQIGPHDIRNLEIKSVNPRDGGVVVKGRVRSLEVILHISLSDERIPLFVKKVIELSKKTQFVPHFSNASMDERSFTLTFESTAYRDLFFQVYPALKISQKNFTCTSQGANGLVIALKTSGHQIQIKRVMDEARNVLNNRTHYAFHYHLGNQRKNKQDSTAKDYATGAEYTFGERVIERTGMDQRITKQTLSIEEPNNSITPAQWMVLHAKAIALFEKLANSIDKQVYTYPLLILNQGHMPQNLIEADALTYEVRHALLTPPMTQDPRLREQRQKLLMEFQPELPEAVRDKMIPNFAPQS